MVISINGADSIRYPNGKKNKPNAYLLFIQKWISDD